MNTTDDTRAPYTMPIDRMPTKLRINYAVGIDPDLKKSGLAVYSRIKQAHTFVDAVDAHELITNLSNINPGECLFYIDAGWLNKGYHHYANMPKDFKEWKQEAQYGYLISRGVDVGQNFGVGKFIYDYLVKIHGLDNVRLIRPEDEKWDAKRLKQITGWEKRTNQDSRDAAKLCFARV